MKRTIILSLALATLNGTMQAMEKIRELVLPGEIPSILQPNRLTEEQKTMIVPIYKAFCERNFAKSVESAKWYGLPLGFLSISNIAYGHRLMKKACREIVKREAHDAAAQSSMN